MNNLYDSGDDDEYLSESSLDDAAGEQAAFMAHMESRRQGRTKRSAAQSLVEIAMRDYDLIIDHDGKPFGLRKGGHVVRALKEGRNSLRQELRARYYEEQGKVASESALTETIGILTHHCEASTPRAVHLRAARSEGALYIDLGDTSETVVHVSAAGWELLDGNAEIPVLFRRTPLTKAMPEPERGGSLAGLWDFVNVEDEGARELVVGWIVAAHLLVGRPCPILAIMGEQGTAKTSAMRLLTSLVDPTNAPSRRPPDGAEKLLHAIHGSRITGFDNLSSIPRWLSDGLCRAVTGDSDVNRSLYTDDDLRVIGVRSVLAFTAIDIGALAGDLAERCVWADLSVIPPSKRQSEQKLQDAWLAIQSLLMGAVFDLLAKTLEALPNVALRELPRMADFAEILAGVDLAIGSKSLSYYQALQESVADEIVGTDTFLVALADAVQSPWVGSGAELHRRMPSPPYAEHWPKPRGMNGKLKRIAPDLRKTGWTVEQVKADPLSKRAATWRLEPPTASTAHTATMAVGRDQ